MPHHEFVPALEEKYLEHGRASSTRLTCPGEMMFLKVAPVSSTSIGTNWLVSVDAGWLEFASSPAPPTSPPHVVLRTIKLLVPLVGASDGPEEKYTEACM